MDNFIEYLNENPTLKIEIGGHTDSRGNKENNIRLSTDRAKAVYDYLLAKKINADRMNFKGYGSEIPIIDDKTISLLPLKSQKEDAHQTNRRTSYRIIK